MVVKKDKVDGRKMMSTLRLNEDEIVSLFNVLNEDYRVKIGKGLVDQEYSAKECVRLYKLLLGLNDRLSKLRGVDGSVERLKSEDINESEPVSDLEGVDDNVDDSDSVTTKSSEDGMVEF